MAKDQKRIHLPIAGIVPCSGLDSPRHAIVPNEPTTNRDERLDFLDRLPQPKAAQPPHEEGGAQAVLSKIVRCQKLLMKVSLAHGITLATHRHTCAAHCGHARPFAGCYFPCRARAPKFARCETRPLPPARTRSGRPAPLRRHTARCRSPLPPARRPRRTGRVRT